MPTESLARKPAFWIVYALVACASAFVAWRLFPLAIPIVNLDITMDRAGALERAEAIAAERALAPADARSAAQFAQDQSTQNYVELEGGGKDAFAKLVAGSVYSPYWWEVRLFRPGEVSEATVRFRPDGTPYGFAKHLAETFVPADPAGLALSVEAAQQIAETRARADWGVDFAPYRLLEKTQQTRTTGRVDHTFVYERSDERIAEARFRMRLVVSGNELTALALFRARPGIVRPALSGAALREQHDRRRRERRRGRPVRTGRLHVRRAVACAQALAVVAAGAQCRLRRRQPAGRSGAGVRAGRLVRFRYRAVGRDILAARSRRRAGDDVPAAASRWALVVHGGGEPHALRVSRSPAAVARLVGARRRRRGRCWAARSAAISSCRSSSRSSPRFYYATNRWLGWWQPSEIAHRSQHPRQRRARR